MSHNVTSWQNALEIPNVVFDPDKVSTNIYQCILRIFHVLVKSIAKDLPTADFDRLRTQAQKFALWGSDVDAASGVLDESLAEAEQLQPVLLPVLSSLGGTLLALACHLDPGQLYAEESHQFRQLERQIDEINNKYQPRDALKDETPGGSIDENVTAILDELSSEGSERSEHGESSEVGELLSILETLNGYLFGLESVLKNPVETSATESSEGRKRDKFDQSIIQTTAWPFIRIVIETYPLMDIDLARRLGQANELRFGRLQTERAANDTILADSDSENADEETADLSDRGDNLTTSEATAPSTQLSTVFDDSHSHHHRNAERRPRAPTSVTTFGSEIETQDSPGRRGGIPKMPDDKPWGEPFDCTICGKTLSNIWGSAQWVRHVYQDLQPYVCTFSECGLGLKTFTSRREWADHEFAEHREKERWYCNKCERDLLTELKYDIHESQSHSVTTALLIGRLKAPSWICKESCPFCQAKPASKRSEFVSHVGRHMQDVSRAAIPMSAMSDDFEAEAEHDEELDREAREDPAAEGYNASASEVQQAKHLESVPRQDTIDPWILKMGGYEGRIRGTHQLMKPFMG